MKTIFADVNKKCLDEKAKELLIKAHPFVQDFLTKDAPYYNVFAIVGNERDEVHMHSKILFRLMWDRFAEDGSRRFLKELLRILRIPEDVIEDNWIPYRERYFDEGRIDFVIESKRYCIAIEMKIDAPDQANQLERYERFCKSRNKEYQIFYLTLKGDFPSEKGMGKMDISKLKRISFEREVIEWLGICRNLVSGQEYKFSFLTQYLGAVRHLLDDGGDDKIMKNLIQSSDDAISVMFLYEGLMEKMEDILSRFIHGIKIKIVAKTGLPTYIDEAALTSYYSSASNTWPGTVTEIGSVIVAGEEYCMVLKIEIEYQLYACLGFVKKVQDNYEWIPLSEMKTIAPDFYKKWSKKIQSLDLPSRRKSPRSTWFYLENTRGETINFREFYPGAIDLLDNMEIELEYIGDYLTEQILKEILK